MTMTEENIMEVETGVEVPPKRYGPYMTSAYPYPWGQMKPGDSFVIRCGSDTRAVTQIRGKVLSAARYAGIRITTRTVEEGLRVWRLNEVAQSAKWVFDEAAAK